MYAILFELGTVFTGSFLSERLVSFFWFTLYLFENIKVWRGIMDLYDEDDIPIVCD